MNDQNLDVISPIQYKDTLLLPIKKEITKLFGNKEIQFQILVKDNKIIIESSRTLELPNTVPSQEASIVK